jgi:hypothetical protein
MSSPAQRRKARNYRRRQACGVVVLRVEVRSIEFAEALIAAHRLSPAETLDRRAVEQQAAAILADWIDRRAAVC